jgi:hypothetical protein
MNKNIINFSNNRGRNPNNTGKKRVSLEFTSNQSKHTSGICKDKWKNCCKAMLRTSCKSLIRKIAAE